MLHRGTALPASTPERAVELQTFPALQDLRLDGVPLEHVAGVLRPSGSGFVVSAICSLLCLAGLELLLSAGLLVHALEPAGSVSSQSFRFIFVYCCLGLVWLPRTVVFLKGAFCSLPCDAALKTALGNTLSRLSCSYCRTCFFTHGW